MIVLANMGTPLMHMGACFLLFLNLFIGWFEGAWIARRCSADRRVAIGFMIVANYASAWVGALTLGALTAWLHHYVFVGPPLYTSVWVLVTLLVGSLPGSCLVELPFVWAATRKVCPMRRATRAFLGAQLVSYVATVALFLLVSRFSLHSGLSTAPIGRIAADAPGAWVYFVSPEGDGVDRVRLDGGRPEQVVPIPLDRHTRWRPLIYAMPPLETGLGDSPPASWGDAEARSGDRWDLWLTGDPDRVLLPNFATRPGVFRGHDDTEPGRPAWWAADMRPRDQRPWTVMTRYFAEEGIAFYGPTRSDGYRGSHIASFAFAHPFEGWRGSSATVLPGGLTVVEFGESQIVVIDFEGRRIGFLTRGSSPVVVLDEESSPANGP